jgi:hypothetical protein
MLAAYLPEADLQAMKRAGSFDDAMAQLAGADVVPTKRPKLTFGSGASYLRNDPDVADAGTDDAGPLFGVPDDAGVADGGAEMDASVDAGSDEESLKLQIVEARRKAAEAKTPIEKRDRTRELFVLLGTLDKLAKTNAPASSSSASSRFKKPEIEIEEDGTP